MYRRANTQSTLKNDLFVMPILYKARFFALKLIVFSLFLDAYTLFYIDEFGSRFFQIAILFSLLIGIVPTIIERSLSNASLLAIIMFLSSGMIFIVKDRPERREPIALYIHCRTGILQCILFYRHFGS